MLFRNFTPFPPLQFESRDAQRRDFGVVVLRGTFAIDDNSPLRPIPKQEPVLLADEFHGAPGKSSLKYESNLAPFKPKTDFHFNATAYAPNGRAEAEWTVKVEAGSLVKSLLVTGPRSWAVNPLLGSKLSQALPIKSLPIRYEQAFGGTWTQGETVNAWDENPIGVGHMSPKLVDVTKAVAAPQILPAGTTPPPPGSPGQTAGLGPVAPSWLPRRAKAGTFNVVWEKTRWPDLPEDFTFDFYNSAAAGLIHPGFVKGDERIVLTNLTPSGSLAFRLPGYQLALLLRLVDGRLVPAPMQLDTVNIDVDERRAFLNWRGVFPLSDPIRVLEVRMRTENDTATVATPTAIPPAPPRQPSENPRSSREFPPYPEPKIKPKDPRSTW